MKKFFKYMAAAAICAAFAFTLSACDDSSTGATDSEITSSDSGNNSGDNGGSQPASSSDVKPASSESKAASSSSETKATDASTGIIKKLKGAADNNGIYTITIELNMDLVGEKGEIEMLYYSKETGTEVQVCDFLAQYEQDAGGSTYTTYTFYNGEVNLNLRNKPEIKFTNEFGAATRADRVEIYYTPDGGKKELVRTVTKEEL